MAKQRQLQFVNGGLTLRDERGATLLEHCYATVQLSNGTIFPLYAMPTSVKETAMGLTVQGGGDDILPKMVWRIKLTAPRTAVVSLDVTNTTQLPLACERFDALVCENGYRSIAARDLLIRRTGWQSFSPAAVRVGFEDANDPWLQPPLHAPLPPSVAGELQLPWMTVLQSKKTKPMLVGFGGARNYLGVVHVGAGVHGHRITASNYLEGVHLQPGQTYTTEPLIITWGDTEQNLTEMYGTYVGKYMQARVASAMPTGWSHWFAYFAKVTQQDILDNVAQIKQRALPLRNVGVDDGYQTKFGDWLSIKKEAFPKGMKYVADEIKSQGLSPGIWLSPFMAYADSDVCLEHPEWFLHDDAGRIMNVNRHGDPYWPTQNYGLDVTHPEAVAWLKKVLKTMVKTWGFEHLKIDFLYAGSLRAKRYDPNVTSVQAYRRGLAIIREIVGDGFVLGCGAPFLPSVGLVDGMRISADLTWEYDLPGVPQPANQTLPLSRDAYKSLFGHMWMNGRLWVNDPDFLRLRQHHTNMSWAEIESLTALIAMSGGSINDSDDLMRLEPEGLALLDRILPAIRTNTAPIITEPGRPTKLVAHTERGDNIWHILARFNWNNKPVRSHFNPLRWELPAQRYHVYDAFKQEYVGTTAHMALDAIAAHGARMLHVCKVERRPQIIATNHHLLGPAGDIKTVSWEHKTLSTTLTLQPGEAMRIWVAAPRGFTPKTLDGCEIAERHGRILVIRPLRKAWRITFA